MEPTQQPGAGTRLDPWVDAYAARTRGLTASQVRALFAVASRPEVVSLAGGMPFVSALPLDAMADTVARLIRDRGAVALQYGSGQGDSRLREQILEVMAPVGSHRPPRRHRRHRGLADGPGPRRAGVLRPRRRRPRRGPDLRHRARGVLVLPVRGRARAHGRRGPAPRRAARGDRRGRARPASGSSSSTRSRRSTTRPASARDRRGAPRSSRSCARRACCSSRTTRTACSASTARCPARSAPTTSEGVVYLGTFSKTIAAGLRVGWAVAPARRAREARAGQRDRDPLPVEPHPAHHLGVPRHPAVVRAGEGLPRGLPRTARRPARVARRRSCPRAPGGPCPPAASTAG